MFIFSVYVFVAVFTVNIFIVLQSFKMYMTHLELKTEKKYTEAQQLR